VGAVVIAVADAATEWRAAAESMLADADALADAKARRDAEDRREYLAELARHLEHHRKAGIPEVVLPLVAAEACGQWWRHLGKSAAAVVPSGLTPTPAVTAIKRWLAGQTADGSPLDSPYKRVLCLLGGVVDTGKTTAAAYAAARLWGHVVPAGQVVDWYREARAFDRKPRQEILLTTPCLVIDDLGHHGRLDELARVVEELAVVRSANLLRTIVTHNYPSGAAMLGALEDAMGLAGASRLRQRLWEFGHILTMSTKTGTRRPIEGV